jgi:hypothetical protein
MLRAILKDTALAYFSVQGGALLVCQIFYYVLSAFESFPTMKEIKTQRYRLLESLRPKGKLRVQLYVFPAYLLFMFWFHTYSRLVELDSQKTTWSLVKDSTVVSLKAENLRLKKLAEGEFTKKDFSLVWEIKNSANGGRYLTTEINNHTTRTVSSYALLMCFEGCKLTAPESIYHSPWLRTDDQACRSLDSKNNSPVRRAWGLAFEKLIIECPGDPATVMAKATLGIEDAPPFKYTARVVVPKKP